MYRTVYGIMLLSLIVVGMLVSTFNIQPAIAEHNTIIVPDDYPTIQEAINHANKGDTIYVRAGTYRENLVIDKEISLLGENRTTTLIIGMSKVYPVIRISANNTYVKGFAIQNGRYGIYLDYHSNNNTISDNLIFMNDYGIGFHIASHNIIINNTVVNNQYGITLSGYDNILKRNKIANNTYNFGIYGGYLLKGYLHDIDSSNLVDGKPIYYFVNQKNIIVDPNVFPRIGFLALVNCQNFTVKNLTLKGNIQGILIAFTEDSVIENLTVTQNLYGICIYSSNIALNQNIVYDNYVGIRLWNEWGCKCTLRSNNMTKNFLNLDISGSYNFQDIDSSNTVNGRPVFYWVNEQGKEVPSNAGYVALINSTEIIVQNLNLSNNAQGILVYSSSNIIIENVSISLCRKGIEIRDSNNNTITHSEITNNEYGIELSFSSNNVIKSNNISGNAQCAVWVSHASHNNLIIDNEISKNFHGIIFYYNTIGYNVIAHNTIILNNQESIQLVHSTHNAIVANIISFNRFCGITLFSHSDNNTIVSNTILENHWYGMIISESAGNIIYHNNFINNTHQATSAVNNNWDNGYPSGGNYWSDYSGIDRYNGPLQNETGSDGIGDAPYVIDEDNVDNYPLMAPFSPFAVRWNETSYQVDFVSNSTISNLNFNGTEKLLSFNAEGPDNTLGICRVTVPKSLMKPSLSEDWQITVDGHPPLSTNIIEDKNMTYLYFTYRHSIHEIKIKIVTQKTLLGTGWGWMRISPKQYVYGPAKLYKIGESQIELIITRQGEDYSRTWNIIWHKEYKNQEIYYCFNPEYGPLMVVIYELKWSFWSAVGKDTVAFKFPAGFGFPRFKIYPI